MDVLNLDEWVKEQKEIERKFNDGTLFKDLPIIDRLIRHKWPEEKPDEPENGKEKLYLCLLQNGNPILLIWDEGWWTEDGWTLQGITHWWELPEVKE